MFASQINMYIIIMYYFYASCSSGIFLNKWLRMRKKNESRTTNYFLENIAGVLARTMWYSLVSKASLYKMFCNKQSKLDLQLNFCFSLSLCSRCDLYDNTSSITAVTRCHFSTERIPTKAIVLFRSILHWPRKIFYLHMDSLIDKQLCVHTYFMRSRHNTNEHHISRSWTFQHS